MKSKNKLGVRSHGNKNLIIALLLVLIIATGGAVVFSGILVMPTAAKMASYTNVETFDILAVQKQKELDILADYQLGNYSLENPYVIQDPYQANPLSALILFETESPSIITVEVMGKDTFSTFNYTYDEPATHHEIAVLGMYAGTINKVQIISESETKPVQTVEISLKTEVLPYDFPVLDVQVSKPSLMEPGVTLMTPCFETNYTYILDANGDVRAYFTNKFFGHGTAMGILQNGRLLATGDVMKMMPYNMYTLWEMNLLGKVFVEYGIPNAIHHDVIELENGDFIAASSNKDMPLQYDTREDVIIYINRETGLVTREYDLRTILDERREPYNHFGTGIINQPNLDWAHLNSVEIDPWDGNLIASSPIQSTVFKFAPDTGEIRWMLSSPEGWDGEFTKYQKYLLTPVGDEEFEWSWGQHSAKLLTDTDNNTDTIDLLMLDNGQSRSYDKETSVLPEENYSRAVIYRVNEKKMTVEQLWQYGKERGSEAYSTFLGNAEWLPETSNILVDFGGMLRSNGVPVDSIIDGVLGKQEVVSRIVEVQQNGETVLDIFISPNNSTSAETYEARRIVLYTDAVDYRLGEIPGKRLGETQSAELIESKLPKFFINRLNINFHQLYEKDGYLIAKGNFTFGGNSYMIGRLNLVLKNKTHEYVFQGPSGMNGLFYSVIDLHDIEPGEYAIYAAGGVVSGMDATGKIKPAYSPTGYKIKVK